MKPNKPQAPEVVPDPFPSAQLPPGVTMHEPGGVSPYATVKPPDRARDRREPPPGWVGSFARCGGCGDFIGDADRCPRCAPVSVATPTVMVAQ